MIVSLLWPKSTKVTILFFSASRSPFLKKPYDSAHAVLSLINLTHLIPAISDASMYAYLSELDAYVGTEITISLEFIPAISKYVFNFFK